ncbi:MAG: TolC family protein, partial [Pseudomonadota bacterium]
ILPATVDAAYEAAEIENPQVRQALYNAQAAEARVSAARAERMPNLSLNGSLGWSGLADPFEPSDYSRNITGRATLTVPLFTGGLTNSRIRAARERENAAELGVEQARRSALQNVTQAWSQLLAARANIGSTDEQVRAARIAAEGVRQEQQVGLRTTIDVLNAEQELRSAELAQISARRDEYVAAASVLAAIGRLQAENLVPGIDVYDAQANSEGKRITWGWVPWEEPIAIVDSAFVPQTEELPHDAPISTAN